MPRCCNHLFLALLFAFVLLIPAAEAEVFMCGTNGVNNSCTPSGLSSLINSASEGDVITVARGTHQWSSVVTLNKNLTITGGGTCPDCGEADPTGTWSWPVELVIGSNGAFRIDSSDTTGLARISGLYINGHGPSHSYGGGTDNGIIVVRTNNYAPYRVDNIRFRVLEEGGSSSTAIRHNSNGGPNLTGYGVWDHIYFWSDIDAGMTSDFAAFNGYGGDNGDTDWSRPARWGQISNTYLEDCTVIYEIGEDGSGAGIAIDSQAGGRVVARNNYFWGCFAVTHGTGTGWPQRSGVTSEYYNNTWKFYSSNNIRIHCAYNWRGGSVYFHHNVSDQYITNMVKLQAKRILGDHGCGPCGSNACADYDGFWGSPYPTGYPCIDQPGMGQASGVGMLNTQPQEKEIAYVWDNTAGTGLQLSNEVSYPEYVVEGRDYILGEPPDYTPLTYPHPYTYLVPETMPPAKPEGLIKY